MIINLTEEGTVDMGWALINTIKSSNEHRQCHNCKKFGATEKVEFIERLTSSWFCKYHVNYIIHSFYLKILEYN